MNISHQMDHAASSIARTVHPTFFLALLLSLPVVHAQEKPDKSSRSTTNSELIVTGSRISSATTERSNPVLTIDATTIDYSGKINLTDLLQELPALTNSQDSNDSAGANDNNFIGGTGLNLLNLRNLGFNRTLVLINGRRHVASLAGTSAVDTQTIPLDLIERVDISTGGASAIYGADGVSGVINFVLRDDFSGFRVRSQFGAPETGGNDQGLFSATAGKNFGEGKGNIAFAVELSRESRLEARQRSYASGRETRFVANPNDPFDDPAIPDRIPLSDLRWYGSGPGGAVDINALDALFGFGDFLPEFDGGTDAPWDYGAFPNGIQSFTYQQGGSGTPSGGSSGDLLPEEKRIVANIFGHYDITERSRLFTELKYVNTQSLTYAQPTFDYSVWIEGDNPFIPANIAAAAGAGNPVLVTRDNFDFGIRGEDIERDTYRAVLGIEGTLTNWLNYNISTTYGKTEITQLALNNRFNDRYAAALDAVIDPLSGQPVCRSTLDPTMEGFNTLWLGWASPTSFTPGSGSGCVPINIFGNGSPSSAAIDWIMTDSRSQDRITQKVATAYLSGTADPLFKAPGGSVGFAIGAEWRREDARSTPAIEDQLGLTFGNILNPSRGHYEVSEAFVEVDIPLINDRPLFQALSVDAAHRYSHYTTIGDASTWKVGLSWLPVEDILIRATRARAVRAPNISELFEPDAQTFLPIDDPCDPVNLGLGTQYRAANCAQLLTAAGADPNTFTDINFGTGVAGTVRGNQQLTEETADTTTVGIMLRPSSLPGFTFSVDYYDIDLTHAINTLDPQNLAEQCVDLPTTSNQFCSLIVREVGGANAGGIIDYTIQPVNVARFRTRGYDVMLDYKMEPGRWRAQAADWGVASIKIIGNHLQDLYFVNLPGADPDQDIGEQGAPRRQYNLDLTWQRGPMLLNYGVNYFSRTQRYTYAERLAQPDIAESRYLNFKEHFTQDIQGRYTFSNDLTIYIGINNLTNEQPDLGEVFYPTSAVGRFWYGGLVFNSF